MDIYGTYGKLVVEPYTGKPLEKTSIPEYADIVRFDVDEYQHFYFDETYPVGGIDILDIGYWTEAGDYVPPDTTHRFKAYDHYTLVIAEDDAQGEEEDGQAAMSAGVAIAMLIDYAAQDCEDMDESDLDEGTRIYTERTHHAIKVASKWLNENKGLYEQYQ